MKSEVLVKTKNTNKVISVLINNKIYFNSMKSINEDLYFKVRESDIETFHTIKVYLIIY